MRRWWFKLFALMLGLVLCDTVQAQEVFYVYRTDGSVQVFELAAVDSMFCSQTDLSGRRQTEFVTQEIWTPDSVYRIPMAEVDELPFPPCAAASSALSGGSTLIFTAFEV